MHETFLLREGCADKAAMHPRVQDRLRAVAVDHLQSNKRNWITIAEGALNDLEKLSDSVVVCEAIKSYRLLVDRIRLLDPLNPQFPTLLERATVALNIFHDLVLQAVKTEARPIQAD